MTELSPKDRLEALRVRYQAEPRHKKFHGIIVGDKGVGKTTLIKTCPKPVLLYSFDPGGTEVLSKEIASGEIIPVCDFEVEDPYKPTAFINYQNQFNADGKVGIFNEIGTLVIDSITLMHHTIVSQILKKEGRMVPGMSGKTNQEKQGMRWQDWGTVLNTWLCVSRDLSVLPCHTVLLGHIEKNKDDVTGAIVRGLALQGKAKDQVPFMLHELYVLVNEKGKRSLLTQDDGLYQASTRMGAGKFKAREEPDISYLLKKAGYPYEDKTL